ncbi:hypothetical protein ACSBR2_003969 [Camellia fascicularis]
MFGSTTPFGQSSNSPFGSPSVSGQNGNASNNQFIPKPCGSTTSFGSPTGGSMFYGTSTSIFGANSSSSESTSTFGAPLYSAFGSSSAPAFGSSSSSFGGSSTFGQKPVFGGFASNPNQSNSFWNLLPQNQTTFQSSPFGSPTSFGASTQNSSGSAHSPAFSAPISSHNCVAAFGFGTGGGAFGAGAPNTLEPSKTSVFGVSKDSSFGASRSLTFGTSSTTGFGFGTTPTFGQSTSASGSSSFFGTALPSFGDQNSFLGAQSTAPTFGTTGFGQSVFCSQHGGSRVAAYTATAEVDDGSSAAKLESISAMTINKDKSHEELRWEDYLFGDKGGPHCMGQSAGGIGGFTVQSRAFDPSPTLAQSPDNPFYSSTASNSVAPQTSSTPFAPQSTTPTFETTDFGHLAFGSQHGGSRVAAYTATAEVDGPVSTQHGAKLHSISAMPINKDKSHEEFRWEDYESGDKGSSAFGQKPVFGGFASNPNQSNSFWNSLPQNQTTFQSSPFGSSTSFGASTRNSSGSAHSPAFGAPISSHNCVAAFGFGTGGGAFGAGAPNTLEPSKASVFGVSKDSSFGASRIPTFGTSSTTGFGFGTTPTFGQSTSASGSSSFFGTALSSFGDQNSFLGAQFTTPTFGTTGFGQSVFCSQHGGSRVAAYTATAEVHDGSSAAKLGSISAITINKDKSHEELRWEDHLFGDKGGPHCMGQSAGGIGGSTVQSRSFDPSPTLAQSPDNPFYSSTASNSVAPQTSSTPFAPQSTMPTFETTGFGHLVFGGQHGGSRVAAYTATAEVDGAPSFSSPLQPTQSAQTTDAFANRKFPQPSAGLSGVVGTTGVLGQKTFSQPSATQSSVALQPAPNVSPFGALPAMPPLSIGHPGSLPSIQYGISSMPVLDKPAAPVRMPSLLTSRHLSQSRIRLPARKYDPKSDGPKVPFFRNDEEMTTTPKTDALFVPRENPRATVMSNTEKRSSLVASLHVYKNGKISAEVFAPALLNGSLCQDEDDRLAENSSDKEGSSSLNSNYKPNDAHNYNVSHKGSSLHIKTTGCKASEATILKENVANVEPLMPQLARSEYYTKPQILELAVKERAEPGFCSHVKDFVVGRHGYGNIKFLGETDVQKLDLDSLVQFNTREVVVYMDEKKKPPVGQGLNKAAEVTLYNVKCIDKKTGKEYINGPNVDKYRRMLIKKATEQGAEFVSYDPAEGEWKFRVKHFSQYKF